MLFFRNNKSKLSFDCLPQIISILEKGELRSIEQLLFQPKNRIVSYLPATIDMLLKFKKPEGSNQSLSIHDRIKNGKYQLIIFEVPWLNKEIKYSPLIFDTVTSKVVGIMLPFNELHEVLSAKSNSAIGKLGVEWTGFILSKQFQF